MRSLICNLCHFEFNHGAHVCRGCNSDVIYGPLVDERKQGSALAAVVLFVLTLVIFMWVPAKLNGLLGTSIAPMFGLSFGHLLFCLAAAALIGAAIGAYVIHRLYRNHIRIIRRNAVR